jgi:hypothetical protein
MIGIPLAIILLLIIFSFFFGGKTLTDKIFGAAKNIAG